MSAGATFAFQENTMRDVNDDLERRARRRAGMKMGWYFHASIYIAVMCFLAVVSAVSGKQWAIFPAFGWGLGLAIHGAAVFLALGGNGLRDRLVQHELRKLRAAEEPW